MLAKQFDITKAKQELKNCPKIVQDYVKLLEQHNKRWKELTQKAIVKIRKISKHDKRRNIERKIIKNLNTWLAGWKDSHFLKFFKI